MSLPDHLAAKFVQVAGYYIHPTMIAAHTATGVILHDGRVFDK